MTVEELRRTIHPEAVFSFRLTLPYGRDSDYSRWLKTARMTILSDIEIESRVKNGTLGIIPFDHACLSGAGYDLRSDLEVKIGGGEHKLTSTLERVEMPDDLAATLHIRSSFARAGIIPSLALVDPGFRGQLTILLYNANGDPFLLRKGERFVQLVLHPLNMKTERPYRGRYQDSQGTVERRP